MFVYQRVCVYVGGSVCSGASVTYVCVCVCFDWRRFSLVILVQFLSSFIPWLVKCYLVWLWEVCFVFATWLCLLAQFFVVSGFCLALSTCLSFPHPCRSFIYPLLFPPSPSLLFLFVLSFSLPLPSGLITLFSLFFLSLSFFLLLFLSHLNLASCTSSLDCLCFPPALRTWLLEWVLVYKNDVDYSHGCLYCLARKTPFREWPHFGIGR